MGSGPAGRSDAGGTAAAPPTGAQTHCSGSPLPTGRAGLFYLGCALVLDAVFLVYAVAIYVTYTDTLAKRTFSYSIFYLAMIFAALMIDHYLPLFQGL